MLDGKGRFNVHVVPSGTRVDEELIGAYVTIMEREFWRNEKHPVVQIALPHFFLSDDVCYATQMPAWASEQAAKIPGRFISGRYPIHLWPRSLNLAFEWVDFESDFAMKRGEPVCYLIFETEFPDRPIRLVRGKLTADLQEYRAQIENVVKYTSGSFALFKEAELLRPKSLLTEA